jgi:hypothetical protein
VRASRIGLVVLIAAMAAPCAAEAAGVAGALVIPVSVLSPLGLQPQSLPVSAARADLDTGLTATQRRELARAQVQAAGAAGDGVQLHSDAFVFASPGARAQILDAWKRKHRADAVAVGASGDLITSAGAGAGVRVTVAFASGARLGLVVLSASGPAVASARATALQYAALAASALPTALAGSAWGRLLEQVSPQGSVSEHTALSAFALAFGPLPGVRTPPGAGSDALSGDVVAGWILGYLPKLPRALADAVRAKLGLSVAGDAPRAARAASYGDPAFHLSATLTQQAQHWASEYAAPTSLDHRLQLTIVAGTSTNVQGGALAETLPVTAGGAFSTAGPYCRIAVHPSVAKGSTEVLDVVLAHEVFHCEEDELSSTEFTPAHGWVTEGLAQWAANDVTQMNPSLLDWMSEYVLTPGLPLFARVYSAVGFWGHVQDQTLDLWQRIPAILRASTSDTAAFAVATSNSPELLSTWGSSFFRDAFGGPAWEITSPIANFSDSAPVHIIAGDSAVAAAPYATAQYIVTVNPRAPIVKIAITGTARLSESQNIEDPNGYYCTTSDCSEACPAGSSLSVATTPLDPDHTELALSGGAGGSAGTVTYPPLSSLCQPSSSTSVPPAGGSSEENGSKVYAILHCPAVQGARYVFAPSVEGSFEVATETYELGLEYLPESSLTCAYASQWIPALTADPPSQSLAGGPPGYLCSSDAAVVEPTAAHGSCVLLPPNPNGATLSTSIFLWVPMSPPP